MKIAAVFLLLLSNSVCASNWVGIASTDDMHVRVDTESIVQAGKLRKAWFIKSWDAVQQGTAQSNFNPYKSMKSLEYFSCDERTLAYLQQIYYSEGIAAGTVVGGMSIRLSRVEFSEVAPDTVGEFEWHYVCKKK